MAYYDWLPTFDAHTNATTSSMVACQTPQHFNGFGVVVLNLAVHLFIFCVVVWMFCSETQYSKLGQAWQAVAQLKAKRDGGPLGRRDDA